MTSLHNMSVKHVQKVHPNGGNVYLSALFLPPNSHPKVDFSVRMIKIGGGSSGILSEGKVE